MQDGVRRSDKYGDWGRYLEVPMLPRDVRELCKGLL